MSAVEAAAPRRTARTIATTAGFAAVAAAAYVVLLGLGPVTIAPGDVVDVLFGGGDRREITVVWDLRMPVAIATLLVGASLGMAGAWTQTSSRNPIASPDILGISGGAAVAVVFGTLVARPAFADSLPSFWWRALLALIGAAIIVGLLFALGGLGTSRRVVLVGVALSLMCHALVSYMMVRADIGRAAEAQTWLAGSTGFVRGDALVPLLIASIPFLLLGLWEGRDLPLLAHDDDSARALGVDVGRVRTRLLIASTGLVAVTVSVVGPIGFVALVAPQLARIVARAPTSPPWAAAAAGAALMSVCAVIAGLVPASAPVGLITACVGGPALVALVIRTARPIASRRTS